MSVDVCCLVYVIAQALISSAEFYRLYLVARAVQCPDISATLGSTTTGHKYMYMNEDNYYLVVSHGFTA